MKIVVCDDSKAMIAMRMLEQTEYAGAEFIQAEDDDTPFGFVTSESMPDMRERAVRAGAKFTIDKPFTAETSTDVLTTTSR